MSQQMKQANEIVEKIIKEVENSGDSSKDILLEKLRTINKLVVQNQNKIWLRTRSGKPMAEKIGKAAADVLKRFEKDLEIAETLDELESVAKEIDEESQRRSMVVT
jgi:hypothetical protein